MLKYLIFLNLYSVSRENGLQFHSVSILWFVITATVNKMLYKFSFLMEIRNYDWDLYLFCVVQFSPLAHIASYIMGTGCSARDISASVWHWPLIPIWQSGWKWVELISTSLLCLHWHITVWRFSFLKMFMGLK